MIRRVAIVNKIIELLSTIKKINGYKTDFPEIKHWSTNIEPKSDSIVCNVRDIMNRFEEDSTKQYLTIEILIGVVQGADNYNILINAIDDVYKCLYENQLEFSKTFGKVEIFPQGDEISIELFDKEIAAGKITIDFFHLQTARWYYDANNY